MKKYYFLIIVALILSLVLTGCTLLSNVGQIPPAEQSGITYLTKHTEGDPFVTDLIADGGDAISATDVGEVLVWNDGDTLYVQYVVTAPWCLTETHLHVFLDDDEYTDVPQKNGNPIPGKFDYKGKHDCLANYTYEIPLVWDLGTPLFIAAHAKVIRQIEDCYETVWQIGDVETIDTVTLQLTCYYDELNRDETVVNPWPPYTNPFVVGTTPDNEFPYNSNFAFGYATDFNVDWNGNLPFGGRLILSWSPGKSGSETKIITSLDSGETETFTEQGGTSSTGWESYKLIESTMTLNPIEFGSHEFRFQHTSGDGTFWDWVRLEKPCEREETAWAAGSDFTGKNWATYFDYTVECYMVGTWIMDVYIGPTPYDRFIIINTQVDEVIGGFLGVTKDPVVGNITGTIEGIIECPSVYMFYTYTAGTPGYTAEFWGIMSLDGESVSGTWKDNKPTPNEGIWTAYRQ